VTVTLSFTGLVLGMQQTDVKPPPRQRVSRSLWSPRVQSRAPAVHVHIDEAGGNDHAGGIEDFRFSEDERLGATPAMRPSTISTSATRSVRDAGS